MTSSAVSLILSTRNRATQLKRCLDRFAQIQSSQPWELIIINNASTDNTAEILNSFATNSHFPVKILYEARRGRSYGLNEATRLSTGAIIAFVDDDCYVAPDHVEQIRKVFSDPKLGFAGGRVELFDPTDYPMTITTSNDPKLYPPFTVIPGGEILGANMMFRRATLNDIGGFDVNLGPGTPFVADDTDVVVRASLFGWWGAYAPNVVVQHHHGRKAQHIPDLLRTYHRGSGALKLKLSLTRATRHRFVRDWYWFALGTLNGRYPLHLFLWEIQGAAGYLAARLRRGTS